MHGQNHIKLVNLVLLKLNGLPTYWSPEITSMWWTSTSPRFLCHCAFLPLCRNDTRYAVRAKEILLALKHQQCNMEPWGKTSSSCVEWVQSEVPRINTFTPQFVYCSRITVIAIYRTALDQYCGSRSSNVCRCFVPLWNPMVRLRIQYTEALPMTLYGTRWI